MTLYEAIEIAEQEESKISYRLEYANQVVARPYQEKLQGMYWIALRAMREYDRLRAVESDFAAWREGKIGVSEHLALIEENKYLKSKIYEMFERKKERDERLYSQLEEIQSKAEAANKAYAERLNEIASLSDENKRLKAEIAELRDRERWIPVGESKPDNDNDVQILLKDGNTAAAYYTEKYDLWMGSRGQIAPIFSHWRPLPATEKGDT